MNLKKISIPSGIASVLLLTGCVSTPNWIASSGPSVRQVVNTKTSDNSTIQIVDVDSVVARQLISSVKSEQFSEVFDTHTNTNDLIGMGDALDISILEAPPATLFGSSLAEMKSGSAGSRLNTLPEQVVQRNGMINIPFAGQIKAAGKTLYGVEKEIVDRLHGKANQPQVIVRLARNASSNVTIVGEVVTSVRMPLSPRGEKLLDALATAGGVRQPINKMTLQVTRGDHVHAMVLENIIRDPKQNIPLQPGDVVTALYQPLSFTVLGATGKNEEQNFEAQGITLAQALARAGGLQDARADAQGVFIFRFEDPKALKTSSNVQLTPEGKVPVVYRIDLKDPVTFFVAQSFPMKNKDVMYVSNAPAAELQKFLNILTSTIFTVTAPFSSGLIK
jgi:polysaccharide export outer membrane protein